jgi:hypothetical protein
MRLYRLIAAPPQQRGFMAERNKRSKVSTGEQGGLP